MTLTKTEPHLSQSAAVGMDGRLYMWGGGCWHQLGLGDKQNRLRPEMVPIPGSVKQVATGKFHTTALTSSGAVFAFGVAQYGTLGLGNEVQAVIKEPSKAIPASAF